MRSAGVHIRWVAVLVVVAVALAACTDSGGDATASTDFVAKPTITLVVNDWTASALNAAVAEQIIERQLGYPVVPTRIDNTNDIYEGLAEGRLDAMLEVWPSTMNDRARNQLDRGDVVDLGPLGPVGKVGWFVPRYVLDDHPELTSWEALQDPDVVALFATPETEPAGRFLGTNPSYAQFDEQIIENLGLPLEVVYSGSEAATIGELEAAKAAQQPILLYWWTPTAPIREFDLVNVALPPSTDECRAAAEDPETADVDCDYPEDTLFKVASPDLEAKAADAMSFLRNFTLSTDDQLDLLQAVDFRGATIDEAASEWITANEETWQAWLEE